MPYIKFLYENTDEKFLEIYRRHDYKHPILIWNEKMRQTLEQTIKQNATCLLYTSPSPRD